MSGTQLARSIPAKIWELSGSTQHLGGRPATRQLLERCHLAPGQRLLDIGCGTGYSACIAAQQYNVQVTGLDINRTCVAQAQTRVTKHGLHAQVAVLLADAHHLPFGDESFDVVIAESVLVFCDVPRVLREIQRVLTPGGYIGINELTLRRSPPAALETLLEETLGIHAQEAAQWQVTLTAAGFVSSTAVVKPIRLSEQIVNHLLVDGPVGYIAAAAKALAEPTIRTTFFNIALSRSARQFMRVLGYGLYVAHKGE